MKYFIIIFGVFFVPFSLCNDFEEGLFLARITGFDDFDARIIGRRYGFEVMRKLESYDDVYIGRRLQRKKRGIEDEILSDMLFHHQLTFISKLYRFSRYKRAPVTMNGTPVHLWNLLPSMRIREAWEAGFNASQVTVAVVDDGVDVAHVDLRSAFSPDVSFDFVKFGSLPIPTVSKDTQHGTQCAGLVAMEGNQCGLGVGHGATLGAIRLLGQDTLNDALEGDALAFRKNLIEIYSVSWGPKDDGLTAEKPAKFTQGAIRNGAIHGRKGLGNIFVWASGNGGLNGDNCALDGYVSNEFTISFGVVDSNGAPASYAEGCSSVLAAVSGGDSMIQTTGLESKCSVISGSSASAAIASGVIALALEANPTLSQRDIQHLIVQTANFSAIRHEKYSENAVGLKFHPNVGFGLLNAQKLVEKAATWKNVGEQKVCKKSNLLSGDIDVTDCVDVTRVERVILTGSVIHPHRGQVRIHIESPHGTISELLPLRLKDECPDLLDWDFVSVHFFGESPRGIWKLHVISEEDLKEPEVFRVKLTEFRITGI